MLRIGGIYNEKEVDDTVFIYLYSKNDIYYGVDVLDLKNNDFSSKAIENILHSINNFHTSDIIHYWYVDDIEWLNSIINGYLGEINKELYDLLLNNLYKSSAWKEWNN